jgi:16S rRNA (cytosine1402-N4)-methyltransferase
MAIAMAAAHRGDPRTRGDAVHAAVLAREVLEVFAPAIEVAGECWLVDGTVGAGGHARVLLEALPELRILAVDQDPDSLAEAAPVLEPFGDRVRLRRARMSQLGGLLRREGISCVAGFLFDVGVCSLHLDRPERGFSFRDDGPLDMRMDPSRERTAADVVNSWDERDLADLFFHEGGERRSRQAASAIIEARRRVPFMRTAPLADTIAVAVGGGGRLHPATRCFQALRRVVNQEGEELLRGMQAAEHHLAPEGRLAVITFHSGEDREVRRFLSGRARAGHWALSSGKPTRPQADEVAGNRRARSAVLRWAIRTKGEGKGS